MNKKLPSVYANKIDKTFHNNKKVFYGSSKEESEELKANKTEVPVTQKINRLFASSTYIYKMDVKITLQDRILEKRIIGRNKKNLITIENEFIPIDEIKDIEAIKK